MAAFTWTGWQPSLEYADTFEAEDAIDLAAISAQLIALDKSSQETDISIASFCLELGIEPPFAVYGEKA